MCDVRTFRYLHFRSADYLVITLYLTCIHNGNGHFTNSCLLFLTRVLTSVEHPPKKTAVSNEQDLVVEECQPLLGLSEESNQSLAQ